jgi:hypothetical protein
MLYLALLFLLAMAHWWYWWIIPSVMLGLVSWAVRSWYPVIIGIPIVLLVFGAIAIDILGKELR